MIYFAISDIHGHFSKLEELLKHWDPERQQLVFIGDYIDRGPESIHVLRKIKSLVENHGAVATMGNHEDMFLLWLDGHEYLDNYYLHGQGSTTTTSFLIDLMITNKIAMPLDVTASVIRALINEHFSELISFLRNLPHYYETESHLFVHAGINPMLRDWKNSTQQDFLWIREMFLFQKHELKQTIVFGHTNTSLLHGEDHFTKPWVNVRERKIGIDGGAGSNKHLNGVILDSKHRSVPLKTYQT